MEKYIDFVIEYKNGKKEISVVNGPGVKCSDVPTNKVIQKLMGENVEIEDFGNTDQYFDEKAQQSQQPQQETNDPFITRRDHDHKEPRQTVDL